MNAVERAYEGILRDQSTLAGIFRELCRLMVYGDAAQRRYAQRRVRELLDAGGNPREAYFTALGYERAQLSANSELDAKIAQLEAKASISRDYLSIPEPSEKGSSNADTE